MDEELRKAVIEDFNKILGVCENLTITVADHRSTLQFFLKILQNLKTQLTLCYILNAICFALIIYELTKK